MSQELMPCPWCPSGGRPRIVDDAGYTTEIEWLVTCEECGSQSALRPSEDSAAEAWNTRPTAQAVAVDDAMVRRALACRPYPDDRYDDETISEMLCRLPQHKRAGAIRAALQAALEGR